MMATPKHNLAGNAHGITTRANRLTPIVSREVEDNGPAELTGSSLKVSQVISEIIVLLHLFCTVLEVHAIHVRAGTRAYQEVIQTFSDAHGINALHLCVNLHSHRHSASRLHRRARLRPQCPFNPAWVRMRICRRR